MGVDVKKYGIVSYNLNFNYSNYGSILQTYALQYFIKNCIGYIEPIVIDYCPDVLKGCNPSNPLSFDKNTTEEFRSDCELAMPAIWENLSKIKSFVEKHLTVSAEKYDSNNFPFAVSDENLDGYICGSDAIWSLEYFKCFDNAFYGNYDCMRKSHTFSYAASFGETVFDENTRLQLREYLGNFKAIGIRESTELEMIREAVDVPVERTVDPTLLLTCEDYEKIMCDRLIEEKYLLLYSRRYNHHMYQMAEKIATDRNLKIVEISLRYSNKDNHVMFYNAGIEEFLSLVRHADYVVTNSLHGTIFSVIMEKQFLVFPRLHGDIKIDEFLNMLGLDDRKVLQDSKCVLCEDINFSDISPKINNEREKSVAFLKKALII